MKAILFDLFETLITESGAPPAGVSSLAPRLGCEREAFRVQWRARRQAVMIGRLSFRQALSDIVAALGGRADDDTLQRLCEERIRTKAKPFEQIEPAILIMLEHLRRRGVRLGLVSNCFAEDVLAWPRCSLAACFDCTVFSSDVGLAKPDPAIYLEATRRLQVDASDTWFIGDGLHEELSGAEQAGLRAFKALWFLRRWPHFCEDPSCTSSLATIEALSNLIEQSLAPQGMSVGSEPDGAQRDESWFARQKAFHESRYLAGRTPREQSGFGGTEGDWGRYRRPIVAAIHKDGTFLDVGCANGLLMESVERWAREAGHEVEPYGLDVSDKLATLARTRLAAWSDRIFVGNALHWDPPLRFDFVRTELIYVPVSRRREYIERLLTRVVAPDGRLILCSYGSSRPNGARSESLIDDLARWDIPYGGVYDVVSREHGFVITRVVWIPMAR